MTNSNANRLIVLDSAADEIFTVEHGNPDDVTCKVEDLGDEEFYLIRLLGNNFGVVVGVYTSKLAAYTEAAQFLQALEKIDGEQFFQFAPDETVAPCDLVNACENYFGKMLQFDRGIRHETQDAPPF